MNQNKGRGRQFKPRTAPGPPPQIEYHEQQPEPTVPAAPKSRTNRSIRREDRATRGREIQNDRAMNQLAKDLDARLFAEFDDITQTFSKLLITPQKRAIPLSTSTRGLGLTLGRCIRRIEAQVSLDIPILPLYRISLAQLHVKYSEVVSQQYIVKTTAHESSVPLPLDTERVIRAMTVNLAPVSMIINSLGNFSSNDIQFYPYIPNDLRVVTATNLRQYVTTYSNPATPLAQRVLAQQLCTIPSATWNNHVLQRPNDIMPENYDVSRMIQDIDEVKGFYAALTKKIPKFGGSVDYNADGSAGQLVSTNNPINLIMRCTEDIHGDANIQIIGDTTDFYSPFPLTSTQVAIGIASLFGEVYIEAPALLAPPTGVYRSPGIGSYQIDQSWNGIMTAMIS